MQQTEVMIKYWQQGLLQKKCFDITFNQAHKNAKSISRAELTAGKLDNKHAAERVIIIPHYAKRQDNKIFFPMMLLAQVATNQLTADAYNPLPIIPKVVLEPSMPDPILLGCFDEFENYIIMQPPFWQEYQAPVNWNESLSYAEQMLLEVTNNTWRDEVVELGYQLQNDALILPVSVIFSNQNLDASLLENRKKVELINAERHSGKSTYAKNLIVDAWIESAIKGNSPPKYVWLDYGQEPKYAHICELISKVDYSDTENLQEKIVKNFEEYLRGTQLIRNWHDINNSVSSKYLNKGGLEERIDQLKTNFKDANIHERHIKVLYSIWQRQVQMISKWYSFLDFIPWMQRLRLKRLFNFFKHNFPTDDIAGLNQRQLEDIVHDKMQRAVSSERAAADALHQAESDYAQLTLVHARCLEWSLGEDFNVCIKRLWQQVLNLTACFWKDAKLPEVENIDLLIVERSEYIDPMHAAQLLAKTKSAVIMGNYTPIVKAKFSVQADYRLASQLHLVDSDIEFEDQQFNGVLASLGNLWNLAVGQDDADKTFDSFEREAISFECSAISSASEDYLGSKINPLEITSCLNWLQNNSQLNQTVAVYTSFGAQAAQLKSRLIESGYPSVKVFLISEPCFEVHDVSIFLPVYTSADKGPYVFDKGSEILDNVIANTRKKFIVIGDMTIFKPQLHSPSGKLAKLLVQQETEVERVSD